MFYKTFLKATEIVNEDFVKEFDFWLATLPLNKQKNISSSLVSSKFNVPFAQAKAMLEYACKEKILSMKFAVRCPNDECGMIIETISPMSLLEKLKSPLFCTNCGNNYEISTDDIFAVYDRIKKPDAGDKEIENAIKSRTENNGDTINFHQADSLTENIELIYDLLYAPEESAYREMERLFSQLDSDYGKNTTARGDSLENLAMFLFRQIKGVSGTKEIHTNTNQFDCTIICPIKFVRVTLMEYFSPYFIIECKNEKESPSNTYFHKLSSIMNTRWYTLTT